MDKSDSKDSLTGIKKRQQIKSANKMVFAWIVAASLVVGICGVFTQFLVRQLMFNNKIYGELTKTQSILEGNVSAYDDLKSSVVKLLADSNLNSLRNGENSNALQVVIDALPTEENRSSFATSMQTKVLGPTGAAISSFAVIGSDDGSASSGTVEGTEAQSFSFSFSVSGSYEQIQQVIRNLERSIRPITVQTVDIQGAAGSMEASITAVTYYQPAKDIQLKKVELKP